MGRFGVLAFVFGLCVVACGSDGEDVGKTTTGGVGGSGGSDGGASASGGAGFGGTPSGGTDSGSGGSAGEVDGGEDGDVDASPDVADGDGGCTVQDTSPYPAMLASALCGLHESCCTNAGLSFTLAQCLADAEADLKFFGNQALCAGGVWDPVNVTKCIDATAAFGCLGETQLKVDFWQQACAEILVGTPNPNAPCKGNPDCFAGAGVASCINGKCAVGSIAAVGQACDDKLEPATSNQVCDETLDIHCVSGICVEAAGPGMACSAALPCADGLSCVANICEADLVKGATCAPFTGPICELGTKCLAGQCGGSVGDSCTSPTECGQSNCLNGKCAPGKPWPLGLVANAACF